jgi:hypothetical protein
MNIDSNKKEDVGLMPKGPTAGQVAGGVAGAALVGGLGLAAASFLGGGKNRPAKSGGSGASPSGYRSKYNK